MTSAITESISFLRENDLKTIFARIRERNVPPMIQFAIYGMCGGLATVVYLAAVLDLSFHTNRDPRLWTACKSSTALPSPIRRARQGSSHQQLHRFCARQLRGLFHQCDVCLQAGTPSSDRRIPHLHRGERREFCPEPTCRPLAGCTTFGVCQPSSPSSPIWSLPRCSTFVGFEKFLRLQGLNSCRPANHSSPARRAVITGMGPVTPINDSARKRSLVWTCNAERSAITRLTRFDASGCKAQCAAEINGFHANTVVQLLTKSKRWDRCTQFAMAGYPSGAFQDAGP